MLSVACLWSYLVVTNNCAVYFQILVFIRYACKSAVYTRVNDDVQKFTDRKQQKTVNGGTQPLGSSSPTGQWSFVTFAVFNSLTETQDYLSRRISILSSLHVAVNVCINGSFVHLYLLFSCVYLYTIMFHHLYLIPLYFIIVTCVVNLCTEI